MRNLTKRRTVPPVFSREMFENRWLWTTASEQSKIAACNVIQFLAIKIYFGLIYKVRLTVYIEFLKIAISEPILSIE